MAEENEQEVYRPYVAELADKRGYIHPIHAKQLAEERTVTMTGDVTGSANWDFGEPATTGQSSESMALTIGNKKVTTDKIDDKAVGSGQMADHSVGLTQIDTNAITSTATSTGADKDKLITSEGVRNAIDNAIEGRGIDYGPLTVDQINALTDIPTGSTAHIIAGGTATVITDGDLPVRVGEDVKYHISGNNHGWYSLDGEFKLKQTAKTDPTASGTTITAIDSITQNENGEITATKKTIRTGNASETGVVKLSDSHTSDSSTNGGVAATPAAVKAAYDLAAGKKDKQTPLDTDTSSGSGKGGTTKTLTRLVQDADGAITPTFSNIADASGSSKGLMSSADYTKLAGIAAGATKTEASSTNGNIKIDGAETTVYTHPTQTAYTGKPTADEAPGFGGTFTVSQVTTNATGHVTGLTDHTITIPSATATTSSNGLMSSSDKSKLAGIAAGAEVNQNAFGNVKVGDVTVAADSKTDTLEIVGGTGIDATGDAANDKVTVALDSATQTSLGKADSAVQSVKINGGSELKDASGNVNIPIAVATGSTGAKAGALSADDKKKINDLGTAAFKNVPASGNASSTEVVLGSDTRLSAGASAVQDVTVDGASVVNSSTKVAAVPNASTSAKGAVQLAGSIGATVASENNKAATEKAVRDAVDTRLPIYNVDETLTSLDFNDFTSTGFHYCGGFDADFTSYSHAPRSLSRFISWRLEVINRRWRVEQILVLVGDGDSVVKNYKRHRNSGNVWSDWQTFVFESDLSSYEQVANKVSAWQTTPDNTHYPSEKLVKDSLDTKADKVSSATSGNFAGLDANGNLTDSGSKAADFATASQGSKADSAIQGVKVNNTTLTPDANKVVTVPLATTSADGAMSAADKTKLNTAATYSQSSGTAPVKVDAYGALTPVPMDSTPTASSTNLMTSGDIKTALDLKVDGYKRVGASASSADSNQHNWQKLLDIKLKGWSRYSAILFSNLQDTVPSGMIILNVSRLADGNGAPTSISVDTLGRTEQNPNSRQWEYSYDSISNSTIVYTHSRYTPDPAFRLLYEFNSNPSVTVSWFSSTDSTSVPASSTEFNAYEHAKHLKGSTVGSTSVPAYVKSTGELAACTDDFVHDADIAKMVQVETAGTAAGSSLQPVYVNASGVATAGDFSTWNSLRGAGVTLNNMPVAWYRSSGNYSVTSGELTQYVEISGLDDFGYIDFWFNIFANNSPFTIHLRVNTYASGRKSIELLERAGYDSTYIESVSLRVTSSTDRRQTKVYLKVLRTNGSIMWRSTANISNSNFAVLTEQQYNALTTYKINELNITEIGTTARTDRHYQRNHAVLDTGDVKSSYSSTGTDPVNGTAVAAALSTSLTDVEYVAAQSGGGGNLNKTKNGSTTSVLAFMSDAEAIDLWRTAWDEAD